MTGLIDEELTHHYPDSLKYICHNGAGYDQVDVEACTKKGPNCENANSRNQRLKHSRGSRRFHR
jgi:lactate dehydrogenase-like 2-hydroxyacid dehydrogenase